MPLTASGGRLLADHRLPEGRDDEEVGQREERLGDAVKVVHVGKDLVVRHLGFIFLGRGGSGETSGGLHGVRSETAVSGTAAASGRCTAPSDPPLPKSKK